MLWTDGLHDHFRRFAASGRQSLLVFAPFVRLEALQTVLQNATAEEISVVTEWTTKSLRDGSSDLEVYPYLRDRGAKLYLLPSLHMKVLVVDYERAVVSTANITGRGLGLASHPNVECATHVNELGVRDQLWFMRNLLQGNLVRDCDYDALKRRLDVQPAEWMDIPDEDWAVGISPAHDLCLRALPRCSSPQVLVDGLWQLGLEDGVPMPLDVRANILHDAALYDLDPNLPPDVNLALLKKRFFAQPLVHAFVEWVEAYRYFGESKAWLQGHCADQPAPARRGLTDHVRILFDWVSALGDDAFVLVRPRHSECLIRQPQAPVRDGALAFCP